MARVLGQAGKSKGKSDLLIFQEERGKVKKDNKEEEEKKNEGDSSAKHLVSFNLLFHHHFLVPSTHSAIDHVLLGERD